MRPALAGRLLDKQQRRRQRWRRQQEEEGQLQLACFYSCCQWRYVLGCMVNNLSADSYMWVLAPLRCRHYDVAAAVKQQDEVCCYCAQLEFVLYRWLLDGH